MRPQITKCFRRRAQLGRRVIGMPAVLLSFVLSAINYRLVYAWLAFVAVLLWGGAVNAQTTSFTYQGRLTDGGTAANGNYDLQFTLWDGAGTQQPQPSPVTVTRNAVAVANGIFTVQLDFGASAFPGAPRFLEISTRLTGTPSFTTLAPRQQITSTPYAVRSLNASSADTVTVTGVPGGSGNYIQSNPPAQQAGANFNISGSGTAGSLNVNGAASLGGIAPPAPAPAGQGRIYFDSASNKVKISENSGAFVNLVGASGVSGSGTTNSIPLWSAGTTLGNSLITQSGGVIQLPNNVLLAPGTNGSQVQFGSPNSEAGMTIAGAAGRSDIRFDGTTLRLLAGPPGFVPSNGIAITTSNVQLPNNVALGVGAQGNAVGFGSPNGETGMSISGVSGRADIRFDGTLKLLNGPAGFTPPSTNGIAINSLGNVGMGTVTPNTRLTLSGGTNWTSFFWTASMNLQNASAIGWEANASGQRFGIGQSTGGLHFFRTNSPFGNTASPPNYDMVITDTGNITQPRANNGLVKAMIFVNANATIIRCYNGVTGASTGTCGFDVSSGIVGNGPGFRIIFPFQVDDRFVSVTPQEAFGTSIGATFQFFNSTRIDVRTFSTDVTYQDSNAPNPFMIIVY